MTMLATLVLTAFLPLTLSYSSGSSNKPTLGEWTDTTWLDNPFMVRLDISKDGGSYICGGSIVATDEWEGKGVILTAAHCVEGADNVNAWVGCTQTNCRDALATGYNDDYYVVHPEYNSYLATRDVHWCDNDIALIFLKQPIEVSGAQRVRLHPDIDVLANDDEVEVFGYYGSCGVSGTAGCVGGSDTDTLEFATTNYMIADECNNIYGEHVSGPHDLCVKDDIWKDGLQGVCMGDSGSPALVDGLQIGLNSWGPGDCDPIYPTVLTSIPHYYGWINETCPQCIGEDGYMLPESESESDDGYVGGGKGSGSSGKGGSGGSSGKSGGSGGRGGGDEMYDMDRVMAYNGGEGEGVSAMDVTLLSVAALSGAFCVYQMGEWCRRKAGGAGNSEKVALLSQS